VICVSPSEAAKAKEMTEELKGAQDREKTASPIAATARARILTSKARPKRSGDHPRVPIFQRDFAGAERGRWPDAESKNIRTRVSSSAAETGRRTRQSPRAIPVLTKGHARSTAPTTLRRPRARRLNLAIGETDAEDERGSPGEDLRVRLDLGRRLLKREQFRFETPKNPLGRIMKISPVLMYSHPRCRGRACGRRRLPR